MAGRSVTLANFVCVASGMMLGGLLVHEHHKLKLHSLMDATQAVLGNASTELRKATENVKQCTEQLREAAMLAKIYKEKRP